MHSILWNKLGMGWKGRMNVGIWDKEKPSSFFGVVFLYNFNTI
jgi:hypothetical protein